MFKDKISFDQNYGLEFLWIDQFAPPIILDKIRSFTVWVARDTKWDPKKSYFNPKQRLTLFLNFKELILLKGSSEGNPFLFLNQPRREADPT